LIYVNPSETFGDPGFYPSFSIHLEGLPGADGKTFSFRGEWTLGNDYGNVLSIDVVTYNGSSYACLVDFTDSDQPDISPTVWVLLASVGPQGTVEDSVLNDLLDVNAATPSSGETLQWNGSAWVSSTIFNSNINNSAAISYSKLNLNNSVDYTDLKDGVAKASFRSTLNPQTGTSYTLQLTDLAKLITLSNTSAITLTIPLESSVAFAIGDRIDVLQSNTGQVTIAGAGGVTVNATPGLKLRARWSSATLIKLDTNSWVVIGDMQA
jgi:hypothetical protein